MSGSIFIQDIKYLLTTSAFLLILTSGAAAQNFFGVGISYGIVNSVSADLYYQHSSYQVHLGGSMQFADTRGNPQSEPSGVGSTFENNGSYYWSIDAGWAYILRENFPVNAVLSIGKRIHYTNYLDSGYTSGGYHTIDSKNLTLGLGVDVGYNINGLFEVFAGFHTLRTIYLGVRVPIPN